jgi:hypothetical protein
MQTAHSRRPASSRILSWQGLGVLGLALAPLSVSAMPCTNMTLVLAIDASGSITDEEFALQLAATARAITDPQVIQAMADIGGVAVTAVLWADTAFQVSAQITKRCGAIGNTIASRHIVINVWTDK